MNRKNLLIFAVLIPAVFGQAPTPPGTPAPAAGTSSILSLDQAIQEAMENNLDLAAERYNVTVSQAEEITAALRPNPVLSVSGQTLNLLGAAYNSNTPLGPNQVNIHTDFPLERGHKRQERVNVARADLSLAELGVRDMMRQVSYRVQSAYVDVQQAKANLVLAQQNLAYLQGVVDVNRARLNSGDLAQVELDRSEVAALAYQTAVNQAQLQLDQAKTQLQTLMGRRNRSAALDVADQFRRDSVTETETELSGLALAQRPDYQRTQQGQARSQADLRLQLANGKIDYSVGTEYTHQQAWGIGGSSLGFYFSVPLPVFNRNQGEIARAERQITQAAARVNALAANIDSEAEQAYREYSVSKSLLENIESNMLSKARSVRDTTEYSYRRGEATLVEFLDAQRAFNDTMQTYNEARASYARSLYRVDYVAGTMPNNVAGQ